MTQYLGIADWYSVHYLSTCRGYFTVDTGTGLLTSTKTNVTCTDEAFGYVFSLKDTVASQLEASVKGLASDIPSGLPSFDTRPPVALLLVGIILVAFEFILLVLTSRGRFQLNLYTFILSLVGI